MHAGEAVTIGLGELRFDATVAGPEDGPVVLLLHGFPQGRRCWRHQITPLAAAGYRVIAPDQRGYSPRARPSQVEDYAPSRLVADALGFIDWAGAEAAHVVGHDWGATLVWQLAGRHGSHLRSATALSVPHPLAYTAALQDPHADQRDRSWYFEWFAAADAADQLLADDAAQLRAVYTATGLDEADADAYLATLGTREALDAALNWYRASGVGLLDGLGAVTVPTMHVWSTEDPALGREGAEATGDHVAGPYRFEVLEDVGHWIPELAADRCTALLLSHLEEAA